MNNALEYLFQMITILVPKRCSDSCADENSKITNLVSILINTARISYSLVNSNYSCTKMGGKQSKKDQSEKQTEEDFYIPFF